jgi:hypothetical protein
MAEIEMLPIVSSNLASAGYDAETQTLRIEFGSGSVYSYSGVSPGIYQALMTAPSPGRFFSQNIKDRYSTTREG